MKILLTGGAGYIGSHTAIALVEAGFEPVVLDNFDAGYRLTEHLISEGCQRIAFLYGSVGSTGPQRQPPYRGSRLRQKQAVSLTNCVARFLRCGR